MNYLAHLLLSENDDESIIGNLAGDFVKGPLLDDFTPRIRRGIELHRRVDGYTDQHPVVRNLKPKFSHRRRRYAGIIIDIAFDHMLCRHWDSFSDTRFDLFVLRIYEVLSSKAEILPPALAAVAPYMIRDDWLSRYQRLQDIGKVLDGISRRLSRKNALPGSIEEVEALFATLETGFLNLFPDVISFANEVTIQLKAEDEGGVRSR